MELTDARLWKLARKLTSTDDLYNLALVGLEMEEDCVAGHLKNKSDSIAMATYSVLKDWRIKQANRKVAYTKMYDALVNVEMGQFAYDALDFKMS